MKTAGELAKKYEQWALEQKAKREKEQDGSRKRVGQKPRIGQ